jgi:hypothetical protein
LLFCGGAGANASQALSQIYSSLILPKITPANTVNIQSKMLAFQITYHIQNTEKLMIMKTMSVTTFSKTQIWQLLRHNEEKVSEGIIYQNVCNLLQIQNESFWFKKLKSGIWEWVHHTRDLITSYL